MRPLLAIVFLVLAMGSAQAATPMPRYLRALDRAYNAGDWTLQCNSSRMCQIIGVAKSANDQLGVRAIVMIRRGIAKDAVPSLRIALVDSAGSLAAAQPSETWRLYARGLPRMPAPVRLALAAADADGAYRVAPQVAAPIISALRRWPGSAIRDRGQGVATMPRGNLARLMRRMDRLQHPARPPMTAAESAEWLKEYHYVIMRASPAEMAVPDAVHLSCATRTYANRPTGSRVGPQHTVWTADCPEGHQIFLQRDGEEPVHFDVRDNDGKIRPHGFAEIDGQSLLEIQIPKKGNSGCGHRLKLGFTGEKFVMIEDRRYERCRAVPHDYWPVVWTPTSWRCSDAPPSNEGNDPPAIEGVKTP